MEKSWVVIHNFLHTQLPQSVVWRSIFFSMKMFVLMDGGHLDTIFLNFTFPPWATSIFRNKQNFIIPNHSRVKIFLLALAKVDLLRCWNFLINMEVMGQSPHYRQHYSTPVDSLYPWPQWTIFCPRLESKLYSVFEWISMIIPPCWSLAYFVCLTQAIQNRQSKS